jgi:hypothetical protein
MAPMAIDGSLAPSMVPCTAPACGHGHGYLLAAEELQTLAGLLQGWTAILIHSRLLHDS